MPRLLAALAAFCLALLVAAPASHAGWFPSEPVDGPNPDVIGGVDVDIARDGTGALVYLRRDGGVAHVFLSRMVAGAWRAPERIDGGIETAATEAAVAVADGGRTVVAFVSGGRLYGTFTPGGAAAGPLPAPTPLHADPDPQQAVAGLALDMGINGTGYAVFGAPGPGGGDVRAVRVEDGAWEGVPVPLDIDGARAAGTGTGRPRVAVSAEGNAVATWGESGVVYGRRITGLVPSAAPQQISLPELSGAPGGTADSPDITIEDDGSFAWVAWRQDFGGVSRSLARRLVGSQFEAAAVLDTGESRDPRIEMTGRGVGLAVAAGPGLVAGSLLERDAFGAPQRLDAVGAVTPVVASSERETAAVAFLQAGAVWGRHKAEDRPFEPAVALSRPELGGVEPGAYDISATRLDDFAVAMTQGPEGARAITVAHYDRQPGAPFGRNTSRYVRRAQPEFKWRPGLDLWGPQTFRVFVDDVEVGQTTNTSFQMPAPLIDGPHRWRVIAVDRRGQQAPMRTRFVRVDSLAPAMTFKLAGKRRARQALKLTVTAADPPGGSGLNRVLVSRGDGSATVPIKRTLTVRYRRAGKYTLVVQAIDKAGNVTREERRLTIRK